MRYWAFISYAHEDERWAAWLQRALESYRLPGRLTSGEGGPKQIPGKLMPIFRDRADFSSSSDLEEQVESALESSRALIVICSPAAARSRWVNEEIRLFRALHEQAQIHCLIVDGDPEADNSEQGCFPPALREAGAAEPLAPDARKDADGKTLSKLKLISGLLGLRLDDLRRRDQQRRHRWMAGAAASALAIAVVMSVLAFVAIQARLEAERAHAETLANYEFLLGDLQSKLVEVGRLDILEDVGSFISARGQLRGLDELSEEEQTQVALAWRQIGLVHQQRSELEQAMDVFRRSFQIISTLQSRYPDNEKYLFELSQAIFYVGFIHYERGEYRSALEYLSQYLEISEKLFETNPADPSYAMEMAYAHTNLFNVYERMVGSDRRQLVVHAREGVRFNELALELEPQNDFYLSILSEVTADLADALMGVCDIGDAYLARLKNLRIAREMLARNPRNAEYREDVANALSGLGHIEAAVGNNEQALLHYDESRQIYAALMTQEPSNTENQWYYLWKWSYSAVLLSDLGRWEEAWEAFSQIQAMAERLMSEPIEVGIEDRVSYGRFLVAHALLAFRRGDSQLAEVLVKRGLDFLLNEARANPDSYMARQELTRGAIQAWDIGVDVTEPEIHSLTLKLSGGAPEAMSCYDVSLAAQQSVVMGDLTNARVYAAYLRGKGYWYAGFLQFCGRHDVCGS